MEGKELTSQPLGEHTVNQTTRDILQSIALTGHAVIADHRNRELHAALDLIQDGICYRASTHVGYFIIKFGRNESVTSS